MPPPCNSIFLARQTEGSPTGTGTTRTSRLASRLPGHLAQTAASSTSFLGVRAKPRSEAVTESTMTTSVKGLRTPLTETDPSALAQRFVITQGLRIWTQLPG